MATATWVRDELDHQGCPYEELHHVDAFTAQAVAQREHISGHHMAKVVVVIADGRPIELILPASRRVVLERVCALLAAQHVRLATEDELDAYFTGCDRGAIPAMRHWHGIDVLMDRSLQTDGEILFQAGTHTDAVRLSFADWFRMVKPRVESFSELTGARPGGGSREGKAQEESEEVLPESDPPQGID